MKLTEILYEDVKEIWDGYLKHPFVSGIGDGSLSWNVFVFICSRTIFFSMTMPEFMPWVSSSPVNRR